MVKWIYEFGGFALVVLVLLFPYLVVLYEIIFN